MDDLIGAAAMALLRSSAAPVAGLSLVENGLNLSTRNCCILACGASAAKGKAVALTFDGKNYYSAIPIRNDQGTVFLAAFRWQLGKLTWQQTGECLYPLLGVWEIDLVGDPAENTRAYTFKVTAKRLLEQVFEGQDLVPCSILCAWAAPARLIGRRPVNP
jgi:hypothetical protein